MRSLLHEKMMTSFGRKTLYLILLVPALQWEGLQAAQDPPAYAAAVDEHPIIQAVIRADRQTIQAGRPVWVEFSVANLTSDALQLQVPNATQTPAAITQSGLPLQHVFSGLGFTALTIQNSSGDTYDAQANLPPRQPVPYIELAPHGSIGTRVELTQYYVSLQRPGKYTLVWRPYGGMVTSAPLSLHILPERQAVILTEFGKITLRFYYEQAPNHVANFMELVDKKFYDNLTFNRVVPGTLIQGGDPKGDRRGVRQDGVRVKAEFSNIPFEMGTVGMARSPSDPDSASCQFYICLSRQPAFDGKQTAFAYVVGEASFETLRRIAAAPTGPDEKPKQPVYIRTISLENVPARESEPEISRPSRTGLSTQPAALAPGPLPPPTRTQRVQVGNALPLEIEPTAVPNQK